MAALVGVVVCARVTCDGCATSFAVRRLADALPCPRCGEAVALGLDVLGAELGGEDVLRPPFEDPTCPACDDRFAVDELHVGLGADTVA
ncbi:MAG: hypothetical protein KC464_01665, partial [Myxococcales bacterium]|nr:hypothetical protein [Myxococcales bacterium]